MKVGGQFLLDPVMTEVFSREMFSQDQRDIDAMVREFAREVIYPHRKELANSLNRELTMDLMRQAGELGLTAIDIPEAHGGLALDKTTSALVAEGLTTCQCASWMVTFSAHVGIGTLPIVYFGTEKQKQKYLPKLGQGTYLGAYALTEPGAGSDALAIKSTATLSEDGQAYILHGAKQFITNAGWADLFIVFAKIDEKDFTAFLVERETPGLSIGEEEHKLGIKGSSTTSVRLDNVRVPKENLLGEPGKGHLIAFNILNIGRFKLGAADLGGCKTVIQEAVNYGLNRKQFGQPIAYFEALRKKYAQMMVLTFMLDSLIYRTVHMMDEKIATLNEDDPAYNMKVLDALEEYAIEASIAKIMGSESLFYCSDQGIQILGGYGFSEEYPMAQIYRDTRIDRIFEGTNEINRMVIYGYFLKKALMEELPLREAHKHWEKSIPQSHPVFDWEVKGLDALRRLIIKALFEAITTYGQDLRNAQIVGEDLADLIMLYYGAQSALNRIIQWGEEKWDRGTIALMRCILFYVFEEAHRIFYRLKPTLFSSPTNRRYLGAIQDLLDGLACPFHPVEEVHILTDDLFYHGNYRYE